MLEIKRKSGRYPWKINSDKETIETYLKNIKEAICDEERAHGIEDEMFIFTLTCISSGCANAKELAELALKSRDIQFPRYYG